MLEKLKSLNSDSQDKMDLKRIVFKYIFIFFIGALAGFIYEEIFYFFDNGELVKRGFLYGPILPVYGWGACLIYFFLKKLKNHPVILFISICLITGILEYFTGLIMFEIWNNKWWDYTGLFMNIDGYVCLRSVITFAIGGFLLLYIIEPLIHKFISSNKSKTLFIICTILISIFFIDNIFTYIFKNPIR